MDECRKVFEDWFVAESCNSLLLKRTYGTYDCEITWYAWEAWKAAWNSRGAK